ncbi:MAG TPA: DUF2071 domain-containing protein [Gemmatimonadaceae bacterium]
MFWTEDPTGEIGHRPWPLPSSPWIMAQRWTDLLFAHWPVDAEALRRIVPPSLPIDLFEGRAWVSIAAFYLSHLRARWLPALPIVSEFPELNVRTYVTLGSKPGVYFFSLDAGSAVAVAAARATYFLPYFRASMNIRAAADGTLQYHSRRIDSRGRPAELSARYRPIGPISRAKPGSLDHWLTERYSLYAIDHAARIRCAEIHHHPWPLQPAEADISVNTMASAGGIELPSTAPRLSFASRLDVVVWSPTRVPDANSPQKR